MGRPTKFLYGELQSAPLVSRGLVVEQTELGLLRVQINRVHRLNAIDSQLGRDLTALWEEISQEPAITAVIVTGSGTEAFSIGLAGGDAAPSNNTNPFSPRMHGVEQPIVAALNGLVGGAAYQLLTEADYVIAAEHSTFLQPSAGTRRVHGSRPTGSTPSARPPAFSAAEAHATGLVNEICLLAELRQRSEEVAHQLSAAPRGTTHNA